MKPEKRIKKIVLAYSGGLDTSVMLAWLKKTHQCPIVAYAADVGQGSELEGLREKAIKTGAEEVFIEDLRDEFARDFVFVALKANAVYEGVYLLGTALARPLIAKRQVELARLTGADAVAHGATGKGNDQARFELTFQALAPDLKILAPWRHWSFDSRSSLMEYARQEGIAVSTSPSKPYSIDRNLMHSSYEGGMLEDPWQAPPEEMFEWTQSPLKAPRNPIDLEIEFEKGTPVALDGCPLSPTELIEALNHLAGEHGVGRVDLVENRFVGIKSRGVYETPALTVLHAAHRAIESITMDREVMHLRDSLGVKISELIYYGLWYSPEFELLRGLIEQSQARSTGTVRVRLYKGNCSVTGRRSPHSLYSPALATFEADSVYDQSDAEGFIRLNALRLRLRALAEKERHAVTSTKSATSATSPKGVISHGD